MARKNRHKKQQQAESRKSHAASAWHADLHPETKKSIAAVFFFLAAALLVVSFLGKGGWIGSTTYDILDYLIGRGYFFAPLTALLIGFSLLFSERKKVLGVSIIGGFLFLFSSLVALSLFFDVGTGGIVGNLLGSLLKNLFGFWGSVTITTALFIVSLLLMLNMPLWRRKEVDEDDDENIEEDIEEKPVQEELKGAFEALGSTIKGALEKASATTQEKFSDVSGTTVTPAAVLAAHTGGEEAVLSIRKIAKKFAYKKPPFELLQGDRGTPSSGDIRANANVIKRTLENFNIDVEMGEVAIGPTVTQYTLRPAEGVKLAKITALNNDLSLALAAHPIRIEAPIPGRSLVGIEVPNRSIALVGLRSLFEQKLFQESTQPLLSALGRDVAGIPVFADLARMPHLLISGATGTGKSVCMHAMLTSFLYRNPPELLRFIIVDPKRVELSAYNDIPHLLTPVITDPKKTIQALRWATKEMDRRYDLLSQFQARDIASYNAGIGKLEDASMSEGPGSRRENRPGTELLPYIVIVIDELADIMALFPREVEASIIRLAQMARAVGIHLIVSTQRPSVEVITGLIKANITSRVAFQVASQVDSRTILDISGAEKLLGNGDMLFLAGDAARPRRIQGAFVSEQEVKRVVDFLRESLEAPEYDDKILETKTEDDGKNPEEFEDGDDPLYEEAKIMVLEAGKASASYLQRRLRVGYARAARLLDNMESHGIIGPADGAKPREVLMNIEPDIDNKSLES